MLKQQFDSNMASGDSLLQITITASGPTPTPTIQSLPLLRHGDRRVELSPLGPNRCLRRHSALHNLCRQRLVLAELARIFASLYSPHAKCTHLLPLRQHFHRRSNRRWHCYYDQCNACTIICLGVPNVEWQTTLQRQLSSCSNRNLCISGCMGNGHHLCPNCQVWVDERQCLELCGHSPLATLYCVLCPAGACLG